MALQIIDAVQLSQSKIEKLANELKPILFPMIEDMVRETWLTGDYGQKNRVTGATVLLSAFNSQLLFNVADHYETFCHNSEEFLAAAMPLVAKEVKASTKLELSYMIRRYPDYNKIELTLKEIEE